MAGTDRPNPDAENQPPAERPVVPEVRDGEVIPPAQNRIVTAGQELLVTPGQDRVVPAASTAQTTDLTITGAESGGTGLTSVLRSAWQAVNPFAPRSSGVESINEHYPFVDAEKTRLAPGVQPRWADSGGFMSSRPPSGEFYSTLLNRNVTPEDMHMERAIRQITSPTGEEPYRPGPYSDYDPTLGRMSGFRHDSRAEDPQKWVAQRSGELITGDNFVLRYEQGETAWQLIHRYDQHRALTQLERSSGVNIAGMEPASGVYRTPPDIPLDRQIWMGINAAVAKGQAIQVEIEGITHNVFPFNTDRIELTDRQEGRGQTFAEIMENHQRLKASRPASELPRVTDQAAEPGRSLATQYDSLRGPQEPGRPERREMLGSEVRLTAPLNLEWGRTVVPAGAELPANMTIYGVEDAKDGATRIVRNARVIVPADGVEIKMPDGTTQRMLNTGGTLSPDGTMREFNVLQRVTSLEWNPTNAMRPSERLAAGLPALTTEAQPRALAYTGDPRLAAQAAESLPEVRNFNEALTRLETNPNRVAEEFRDREAARKALGAVVRSANPTMAEVMEYAKSVPSSSRVAALLLAAQHILGH